MLTANSMKIHQMGDALSLPVKGNTKIYKMALVAVDDTGFAVPADDVAGHVFTLHSNMVRLKL